MDTSKTLLAVGVAIALLSGCKKHDDAAADTSAAPPATEASEQSKPPVPSTDTPVATPAAPVAKAFDINAIPVSTAVLPAWPYMALPTGYHFRNDDDLGRNTKDLARVPVWTGGQLSWVVGKTFSDTVNNDDGKTFSKFELLKNLQQAIEALGGVRISQHSYDEATYKASQKEIDDFRQEFDNIRDAYWYDADADTFVIHRADKAIWVVVHADNNSGGVLIAEGPLPEPPAKQ